MKGYHSEKDLSPQVVYIPAREVLIARNGALLTSMAARYDTLEEYIEQFAALLSSLKTPGMGIYSFSDPVWQDRTLILHCLPEPCCDRCHNTLHHCACAF
jgi:hypothetical protein